jgi:two-component system NtrC family sensor kinase
MRKTPERREHPVSEVPITERNALRRAPEDLSDRLLTVLCSLEPGTPVELAVGVVLDVAAEAMPELCVGVCFPGDDGPVTLRRTASRASYVSQSDPTRLFPERPAERILSVEFERAATLHFAGDDEALLDAEVASTFAARLSLVVGQTLRQARALDGSREVDLERHELEAQLVQAEKLATLGQMAAGVVHELNNPLTSILAYTDLLLQKAVARGSEPSDVERLTRIADAAHRILRFSRELVAYARPSTDVPAPVSIHDVLEKALVFCDHVLAASGVEVDRHYGAAQPIRGIPGQLTQVFVNLLTNACDALQAGGRIQLVTEDAPGFVIVRVADDGDGIAEAHISRVFEPFFTTKGERDGTGLGLSIVHRIIAGHHGAVRVERRSPRGTAFVLELPVGRFDGSL